MGRADSAAVHLQSAMIRARATRDFSLPEAKQRNQTGEVNSMRKSAWQSPTTQSHQPTAQKSAGWISQHHLIKSR